jgi:uncharacterized protein with HEPN domain
MDERFLDAHSELPMRVIEDIRNLVAHECDAVRPEIVWDALVRELPGADEGVARLLGTD